MAAKKGWPVSGLTFTIKDKKAVDVRIGGMPINESLVYKIAVSDYIARGGDNCDFLQPLRKRYTSTFIRDALIDYVAELEASGRPLHPELEQRVRYAE
jgi:2',3'-cyclic-nucleotide 2'-phosphodiesterase (5'-nucleotidase family)